VSDQGPKRPTAPLADVIEDIVFDDVRREQLAMTREELDADVKAMGYDAEAFGREMDAVLAAAVAPPLRSKADVIEDIVFEDALAEQRKMTPEELDADLAQRKLDPADLEADIAKAMGRAGMAPFEAAPATGGKLQSGSTGKVVDLQTERAKRVGKTRWMMFLPAAAAFTVIGGGAAQQVATIMPEPTVTYPTNTHQLTTQQVGQFARGRALQLCKLQYWGECEDMLDRAKAIDPEGENVDVVTSARQLIGFWHKDQPPGVEKLDRDMMQSKGPLGPGERRLQRR